MPSSSRNTAEVELETTKDLIVFDSGVNYNWSAWQDPQPSFPPNVGQALTNQPTPPPAGVWNNDQAWLWEIHPLTFCLCYADMVFVHLRVSWKYLAATGYTSIINNTRPSKYAAATWVASYL